MNKTYLRYSESYGFGVIAHPDSNLVVEKKGKYALTSGVQNILVWNVNSGELEHEFKSAEKTGNLSSIALNKDGEDKYVAGGYTNGGIRLWEMHGKRAFVVLLSGHRSAVTCMSFSKDNSRLASGAKDTDIVIWDVVTQAGLFRLKGHKQPVHDLKFLSGGNEVISCSKDTLVKVWDLETQHCSHTFVGHRSPIHSITVSPDETKIITASSDQQLRAFERVPQAQQEEELEKAKSLTSSVATGNDTVAMELGAPWRLMSGSISRQSAERAESVQFTPDGKYFAVQAAGKTLELYKVRTEEKIRKKVKRRLKRITEKKNEVTDQDKIVQMGDVFELVAAVRTDYRMRSFGFCSVSESEIEVVISFITNCLERYTLHVDSIPGDNKTKKRKRDVSIKLTNSIELQGHRSDVRAIALSGDDTLLLTASNGSAKLWNVNTKLCIRTFPSGYSLCCAFIPGDAYALVGTRTGHLLLFNLSSGKVLNDIAAHEGAIWSLDVRPDGKGFVTGSADKLVKFWEFELDDDHEEEAAGVGEIEIVHTRTLKMSEDVMCVRYSKHKSASRLMLAVSLLDCTVKVFHEDSLKFALSLYGHKLPVLSIDISSDSTLIATASADKNVKIWGLDFGDCHKSFFAHDANVMCVRFVPQTHYIFTAGKDNRIRFWDADRFEMIMTMEEVHCGEVWALCVSSDGKFFVSCGHDRSLRVWHKTSDIVFPEEEKDIEMEKKFDAQLMKPPDLTKVGTDAVEAVKALKDKEEVGGESALASRRTVGTVKAAERLIEAIDIADAEQQKLDTYEEDVQYAKSIGSDDVIPKPVLSVFLLGRSPLEHVIFTLRSIKSNELEDALIVQPFAYSLKIIQYLERVVEDEKHLQDIELVSKIAVLLTKMHFKQIVATQNKNMLLRLQAGLRSQLEKLQTIVGTNMAATKLIKNQVQEQQITL